MSIVKMIAVAIAGLMAVAAATQAATSRPTITCPYPDDPDEQLKVVAPAKIGDLPPIDFDYPAKVTRFSFRDGHLLLIVISAQLNKVKGSYDGQIVLDLGGHQIMLRQGPVSCTVAP